VAVPGPRQVHEDVQVWIAAVLVGVNDTQIGEAPSRIPRHPHAEALLQTPERRRHVSRYRSVGTGAVGGEPEVRV
jgi:hypothetical protein